MLRKGLIIDYIYIWNPGLMFGLLQCEVTPELQLESTWSVCLDVVECCAVTTYIMSHHTYHSSSTRSSGSTDLDQNASTRVTKSVEPDPEWTTEQQLWDHISFLRNNHLFFTWAVLYFKLLSPEPVRECLVGWSGCKLRVMTDNSVLGLLSPWRPISPLLLFSPDHYVI